MKRLSIIVVIGALLTLAQLSQVFGAEKGEKDKKKEEMSERDKKVEEILKRAATQTYISNKRDFNRRKAYFMETRLYGEKSMEAIFNYATLTEGDQKLLGAIRIKTGRDYSSWSSALNTMRIHESDISNNSYLYPELDSRLRDEYINYLRDKAIENYKTWTNLYVFESGDSNKSIETLVNGIYVYPDTSFGIEKITVQAYFAIMALRIEAIILYLNGKYIENVYGVALDKL